MADETSRRDRRRAVFKRVTAGLLVAAAVAQMTAVAFLKPKKR